MRNDINKKSETKTNVRRPGRYIGQEWNLPNIEVSGSLRCVLCYPDVYEIGMSHPGLQILYHHLNSIPGVAAERVFAPWPDKENSLRSDGDVLRTLETGLSIGNADVLCFTIPHELCYTNILNVLDLSGLPLQRQDRNDSMPFVIGGGITTLNPLPLSLFFDGFFIGEADDLLYELINVMKSNQRTHWTRVLSSFPGMYIPDIHRTDSSADRIIAQHVIDLESIPLPNAPLTPWCKPVHERVVVEVARGCPGQCRFCQARNYYSPVRIRSPKTIKNTINTHLAQTGYDEVSLLSLNIADYPGIEKLLPDLMNQHKKRNVSVSLPSLRPEKLTNVIIDQIGQVRKTGFTLAPEAGSDRLRTIIGKPFPTEKLVNSVATVFQAGWNVVKLYFMIGLPFETDEDVRDISALVRNIYNIGQRIAGRRMTLHVSVAIFIPKTHTPFQWFGQAPEETLLRRRKILLDECRLPGVKLSLSDIQSSRLEACFARGRQNYSQIIEWAFRKGCRMDAWKEMFKPDIWDEAFKLEGLSPEKEAVRLYRPEKDLLPWSFIVSGVSDSLLLKSYHKACQINADYSHVKTPLVIDHNSFTRNIPKKPLPGKPPVSVSSYIAFFQVVDDFRLFSHLEIMTGFIRALRRTGLPLVFSQGFNPHPKVSWTQPVPLGFERWSDPVVFQLDESIPEADIKSVLNEQLPAQLAVHSITETNHTKPLRQFTHAVIALKAGKRSSALCDFITATAIIGQLELRDFNPFVSDRLKQADMDVMFSVPFGNDSGPSLKTVTSFCFNDKPMPLNDIYGIRVGWLNKFVKTAAIFGMETLK
jgi:radical SAM family uncharacterized protein